MEPVKGLLQRTFISPALFQAQDNCSSLFLEEGSHTERIPLFSTADRNSMLDPWIQYWCNKLVDLLQVFKSVQNILSSQALIPFSLDPKPETRSYPSQSPVCL